MRPPPPLSRIRRGPHDYEFQRLHGMGEALYEMLLRIAADGGAHLRAGGGHHDLLAYLVRRLLENGASGSFVTARPTRTWRSRL